MSKTKEEQRRTVKRIEQHLRNYHQYKIGIRNIQLQLDSIMPNVTVRYELREGSAGIFIIDSSTEKYAIDRVESKRVLDLHEELSKYKMIVECIDRSIEGLDDNEKEYIKQRYFFKNTSTKVAEALGYGESTVFVIRSRIMEKLSHSLGALPEP